MNHITEAEYEAMERWKEKNRLERIEYIRFKVKWMREHGQIVDPKP